MSVVRILLFLSPTAPVVTCVFVVNGLPFVAATWSHVVLKAANNAVAADAQEERAADRQR
jgi:ABC-type Mn2+/Zn2+ transport system permease subunit